MEKERERDEGEWPMLTRNQWVWLSRHRPNIGSIYMLLLPDYEILLRQCVKFAKFPTKRLVEARMCRFICALCSKQYTRKKKRHRKKISQVKWNDTIWMQRWWCDLLVYRDKSRDMKAIVVQNIWMYEYECSDRTCAVSSAQCHSLQFPFHLCL